MLRFAHRGVFLVGRYPQPAGNDSPAANSESKKALRRATLLEGRQAQFLLRACARAAYWLKNCADGGL
jgi:hypothetical protein